jgi:hypothetical protein
MKNIIILFTSIISAFVTYALFSGLLALTFCIQYKDVVQFPATIVFIGLFSLCTAIFVADNMQNSEML